MNRHQLTLLLVPVGLTVALATGRAQEAPPQPEGVEVQARGPVHEAYAEPTDAPPAAASPVVSQAPPEPVAELPPEQKPEGDEVIWIPGYWDWEEDAQQYVWVSGFWREKPPGRKWVPGFWQQVEGGWQRVHGFWAPENQDQLEYVPPPPESLENGPSAEAPDANSVYVPGCWVYRQTRYFWRPGFWMPYNPDWVWVPACYQWTPGGYLFVEGYWDYPLCERGLLFAPVRFARARLRREFTYVPSYAVRGDFLLSALFVRPDCRSYYFGDYFEERYTRRFIPWVDYQPRRGLLDTNFRYYQHQFARTGDWVKNLRTLYRERYRNEVPRPPRTWTQQVQVVHNLTEQRVQNTTVHQNINFTKIQNVSVLEPLSQVKSLRVTNLAALAGPRAEVRERVQKELKLLPVSKEHRTAAHQAAQELWQASQKRRDAEIRMSKEGKPLRVNDQPRALKLELPKHAPNQVTPPNPAVPAPKRLKEPPPPARLPAHREPGPRDQVPPQPPSGPKERPVTPPKGRTDETPVPKPKEKPPAPQPPTPRPQPAPRPEPPAPNPQPVPHPQPPAKPPQPPAPHPQPPAQQPEPERIRHPQPHPPVHPVEPPAPPSTAGATAATSVRLLPFFPG